MPLGPVKMHFEGLMYKIFRLSQGIWAIVLQSARTN